MVVMPFWYFVTSLVIVAAAGVAVGAILRRNSPASQAQHGKGGGHEAGHS